MHAPIHLTYDQLDPIILSKAVKDIGESIVNDRNLLKDLGFLTLAMIILVFLLGYFQRNDLDVGIGIMLGVIGRSAIRHMAVKRSARIVAAETKRVGPYKIQLDATGFHNVTSDSKFFLSWRAIDAISDIGGGTGLVTASCVYPLSDDGLPEELSPDDFRKTLETWRLAAH